MTTPVSYVELNDRGRRPRLLLHRYHGPADRAAPVQREPVLSGAGALDMALGDPAAARLLMLDKRDSVNLEREYCRRAERYDLQVDRVISEAEGHFIAGFIEGEGHFGIAEANGGQSFRCLMSLRLRDDDVALVEWLRARTGVGTLRAVAARSTSNPQVQWLVQTQAGCRTLVEMLTRCEMRGRKAREFEIWRRAVALWTSGKPDRVERAERLRRQPLESRRFHARANPTPGEDARFGACASPLFARIPVRGRLVQSGPLTHWAVSPSAPRRPPSTGDARAGGGRRRSARSPRVRVHPAFEQLARRAPRRRRSARGDVGPSNDARP
jgi:hypothetical protein